MKPAKICTIFFLFIFLSLQISYAKVPKTAHEGERVQASIDGQYFNASGSVWARIEVDYQHAESDKQRVYLFKMAKIGETFNLNFDVPKGAARLHFIYATKDTAMVDPTVVRILDAKNRYVRRARLIGPGVTPNAKRFIKQELATYPDSYEALLQSWEIADQYGSHAALKKRLSGALKAYLSQKRNTEFYNAVIWAYAKLQNTRRISHCFSRYEDSFPHSHYFLKTYEAAAEIAAQNGWSLPDDVQEMALRHLTNNLSAENMFEYGYLLNQADITAAEIEDFVAAQTRKHGEVPMIYYNAASAYFTKMNHKQAATYARQARQLMSATQPDAAYFQDRMAGQQYKMLWPHLTKILVVSYMALDEIEKALHMLKNGYSAQRNMKIDGELYALEARCWEIHRNYEKAEDLYFKAYILGLLWTQESLRDVYRKMRKTERGFDAYFSRRLESYQ